MAPRLSLHNVLKAILGSNNVYFQPPPGFMMSYPCIVYERSNIFSSSGDNTPYKLENEYTITVMDMNPDSVIPVAISKLARCVFDRHVTANNLNHDVFNIIF